MIQEKIVNFGDIVVFETEPGTFLSVDVAGKLIWYRAPDDLRSPINFEKCLWRVVERLSYVDQEMKFVQSTRGRSDSISSQLSQTELDLIDQQAEKERIINQSEISTANGSQVVYGRVIQLQHVATEKYLSTTNEIAELDRECIALGLTSGSSASYFRVQPKYKVRNEGGPVLHKDDIILASLNSSEYFMHQSKSGPPLRSKGGFDFYEANLSRSMIGSSMAVNIYSNYSDFNEEDLYTGQAISLFDREQGAFMQASCCPHFNLYHSIFPIVTQGPPDFDPKHPDNFSSRNVWCLERASRTEGGFVSWSKEEYRIKHIPTQRYLTVCPINMLKSASTSSVVEQERQFRLTLEVDGADLSEPLVDLSMTSQTLTQFIDPEKLRNMAVGTVRETVKIGKVFLRPETYNLRNLEDLSGLFFGRKKTRFQRQTFSFKPLDGTDSTHLPTTDVMLSLVHHDIEGRELYYHCNENGSVCMSTVSRTYDALLLNRIEREDEEQVRFLMETLPVLKNYISRINDMKFPATPTDLELENKLISRIIFSSIKGADSSILDSSSAALSAEGPPLHTFQNFARDQYFLDLLLFAVVAPINVGIKVSFGSRGRLDWDDHRFRVLSTTHKLAWRALLCLIAGNPLSQIHIKSVLVRMVVKFIDRSKEHIICKILQLVGDGGYFYGNKWYNYTLVPSYDLGKYSLSLGYDTSATALEMMYRNSSRVLGKTLQASYLGLSSAAQHSVNQITAGCDPAIAVEIPESEESVHRNDHATEKKIRDQSTGSGLEEKEDESSQVATLHPQFDDVPPPDTTFDFDDDEEQATCMPNIDFSQFQLPDFDIPLLAELGFTEERDRRIPLDEPPIPFDERDNHKPAIDVIVNQVPFPVGAAEVLTSLIGNNRVLLAAYVDDNMVDYFKNLIKTEGPSSRFMQFFRSICSCQEEPIVRNQQLCLENLITDQSDSPDSLSSFAYLMIKVSPIIQGGSAVLKERPHWHTHELPDIFGELVQFMGVEAVSQGFPEVAVHWTGTDHWDNQAGALYVSPEALGFTTVQTEESKESVNIVDFCWPLDQSLCQSFTGLTWKKYEEKMEKDLALKTRFLRRQMFAQYFLSQIETYAEMCRGRAYNCIKVLEEMFPFDLLLSLVTNNKLAFSARTVFLRFIRFLWLERFPHENHCGRASVPTLVWVLDSLPDCPLSDSHPEALPSFKRFENSKLLTDPQFQSPVYSIDSPYKFVVLNYFSTYILEKCKRQVSDQRDKNEMIQELINVVRSLLHFGFFPKVSDIQSISKLLMLILDGRDDVDSLDKPHDESLLNPPNISILGRGASQRFHSQLTIDHTQSEDLDPFYSPPDIYCIPINPPMSVSEVSRYQLDARSMVIMETKLRVLSIVKYISDLRNQFRLGRLLNIFRLSQDAGSEFDVYSEVSSLFDPENRSYNALNLMELCPVDFDAILIDLMQYEDDTLFEAAFNILCSEHEQTKSLFSIANSALLLRTQSLPILGTFRNLEASVMELRELLSTMEGWATHSVPENFYRCWHLIDTLQQSILHPGCTTRHQKILLLLDLQSVLLRPFAWDLPSKFQARENRLQKLLAEEEEKRNQGLLAQIGFKSAPEGINPLKPKPLKIPTDLDQHLENLIGLTEHCIETLELLCQHNPEIRFQFTKYIPTILELQKFFPSVFPLIIEIFRGNKLALLKTPDHLFSIFSYLLHDSETTRKYSLVFFQEQLLPEDSIENVDTASTSRIPRNQRLVIQAILDAVKQKHFQFDLSLVNSNRTFWDYINMVELLALCSHQNLNLCGKLAQSMLAWDKAADQIRLILLGDRALTPEQLFKKQRRALRAAQAKAEEEEFSGVSPLLIEDDSKKEDLSLGLDLKGLTREFDPLEIEKMIGSFVRPNLKYIQYINFDSKGFDEKAIQHTAMSTLVEGLCQSLVEDDFVKRSFQPFEEDTIIAKLKFLDRFIFFSKRFPNSDFILLKVQAAFDRMNRMIKDQEIRCIESKYSSTVISAHAQCLEQMKPLDVLPEFRPGEAAFSIDPALRYSKNNPSHSEEDQDSTSLSTSYLEFIAETEKKFSERIESEKQETLTVFLNSQQLTDPLDPVYSIAQEEKNGLKKEEKKSFFPVLFTKPVDGAERQYSELSELKKKKLQSEERSNVITWEDTARRFIRYVQNRIRKGGDFSVVVKILDFFVLFMTIGIQDEEEDKEEIVSRQNQLNDLGIPQLVHTVIGYSLRFPVSKSEPNVILHLCLKLVILVLKDNEKNIEKFKETVKKSDLEGNFFQAFKTATLRFVDWVKETRYDPESPYDNEHVKAGPEAEEMNLVLDLLTLLCLKHNIWWQDAFRDQRDFKRQNVNLLECVAEILEVIVPRRDAFNKIRFAYTETLIKTLECLVTAVQGPCPGNQKNLSNLKTFACSFTILSTKRNRRLGKNLILIKTLIIKLLYSCLENLHGSPMEERISQRLEKPIFDNLHIELSTIVKPKKGSNDSEEEEGQGEGKNKSVAPMKKDKSFMGTDLIRSLSFQSSFNKTTVSSAQIEALRPLGKGELRQAMKDLLVVRYRLARVFPIYNTKHSTGDAKKDKEFNEALNSFNEKIAIIEVQWKGAIEEVIFPVPQEAAFLSEATKKRFELYVPLDSRDTKLKDLMSQKDDFFDEMEVYSDLTKRTKFYSVLQKYYLPIKYFGFSAALMLNLNLILNLSVETKGPADPYYKGMHNPQTSITFFLSILVLIVYFIAFLHWVLPAFPLQARRLRRLAEEKMNVNGTPPSSQSSSHSSSLIPSSSTHSTASTASESSTSSSPPDSFSPRAYFAISENQFDRNAFTYLIIGLLYAVFFFVMHFFSFESRYPTLVMIRTYGFIVGIVFGLWFIKSLRDFIIFPSGYLDFFLCMTLDIFSDSNLLLATTFAGMAILGIFGYSTFYTILLLDFLTLNSYAKICVDSVLKPYNSLIAILLVFLIATAIFGVFGVNSFGVSEFISVPGGVAADEAGQLYYAPSTTCNSMTSCLGIIFYGALRSSDIANVMVSSGPGSEDFTKRFFFDMAFFIIIGVLLFNMVTGIIVDTFSSLREEAQDREDNLRDNAFVSGLTREELSDNDIDYQNLVENRQNHWTYINFAYYLSKKKPEEMNGVEAYVSKQIEEQNYDWFPKTCIELKEKNEGSLEEEDKTETKLHEIDERMKDMEETLKRLLTLVSKH